MSKAVKEQKFTAPYVSADTFIKAAKPTYRFEAMQARAFRVQMKSLGKYYLPTLEDFVPYFEKYLGIDKKEGK